ncbi:MAG: hypothetical protein ACI9Q4_001750 [Sediminicola sp.]|jgi:hypothetical protein
MLVYKKGYGYIFRSFYSIEASKHLSDQTYFLTRFSFCFTKAPQPV